MILSVEKVDFAYPSRPVLQDITFNVQRGEFVALLGTNGTGKTSLLKCINHILEPQSGGVLIESQPVLELTRRILAQKIGYVEQQRQGNRMTVFDAVLMGRKPYINWDATRKDLEIVSQVLNRMNLTDYSLRYLDELSGGELQKIFIARALAQQPEVLLMDEPTSSLDLRNQIEVLKIARQICHSEGIAVIAAMHDINQALRYADRYILLKDGQIFTAGDKTIMTPENLQAVYGVEVAVEEYNGDKVVIPLGD
ncbi:ABC transporter ATP-binding protein [Chloroflexota bacterium]|nr:ABC transporter ATP-binding protein [Chloroflexota bacterium]